MTLEHLVRAAARGDEAAYAIVDRFQGLVWATARAHRLSPADAADVAQTTWLRLVEHLDRIRDPERLAGWLATTARNESLRHIRLHGRELAERRGRRLRVALGRAAGARPADGGARQRALAGVREAQRTLQSLLRMLVAEEEPSYEEVGAALGMPIGAIGPTRMRCLEKLRAGVGLDPAFQGGVS